MNVRIPPVVVVLVFGALMYLLHRFLPVGDFLFYGRLPLALLLTGIGVLLLLLGAVQFWREKTTLNPLKTEKTSTLVTSGIYQYTRNPMYLAMLLFLLAYGLYLGNAFNALTAAGFVSYLNHFQIQREETELKKKFGKTYLLYQKAVRRWF